MDKNNILTLPDGNNIVINEKMLSRQDAWKNLEEIWKNLEEIKKLHLEKNKVFSKMKKSRKKETLKKLAEEVGQIEFKLQAAWNFPLDKNYHRWFEVPKCTCPKMDNIDMLGTKYRIIAEDCPIHGKEKSLK